VNKRLRTLLLITVLLLAAAVLSGCGVPQQGPVDLAKPPGLWEAIVVYPLVRLLIFLNDFIARLGIPYSWGWAIIVLTLLLKLVTLPLTRKQLQSTKATQELQPRLAELQAKYGKDRQKLSEEQMKLYKEAGVNPMGGCLPLLIQMPILFGLYQALYILASPGMNELAGAPFFFIPDLALPTSAGAGALPSMYSGVNFSGTNWISGTISTQQWALLIAYMFLPVLMLISSVLMQKMSQPPKSAAKSGTSQQQSQTQMMSSMMMFMPVMFGYITLGLPSGLTLYWTTSNILSMVQQYFVAGWGGLVDWFPMLKPKPAATAIIDPAVVKPVASTATTTGAAAPTVEPKPEKRRRRRK
jgi:YidC/Oxa1 family membrane protein insertase